MGEINMKIRTKYKGGNKKCLTYEGESYTCCYMDNKFWIKKVKKIAKLSKKFDFPELDIEF